MVARNVERAAVGARIYGMGRTNPTAGPVDILGYRERDMKRRAHQKRRNALLRRMQAKQQGRYMSADYLRESS